jgi:hypothetical protein
VLFKIISAPISSSQSFGTHFTVAFVQTGIKTGVSKLQCSVKNSQTLANQSVFSILNSNIKILFTNKIYPNYKNIFLKVKIFYI